MGFSREDIFLCQLPENHYVFENMDDYLTMLAVFTKAIADILRRAGDLSPLQYRILSRIRRDRVSTVSMLAQEMRLSLSTVSSAVAALGRCGLIERTESSEDRRAVRLALTPAGRKTVTKVNLAIIHGMDSFPDALTACQTKSLLQASANVVATHPHRAFAGSDGNPAFVVTNAIFITKELLGDCLKELGLIPRDYRVMLAVEIIAGGSAERATASGVAEHLLLNPSDITSCLNNLSAHRLITRERCSDNRRQRQVVLTAKGKRSLQELTPQVFEALYEAGPSSDETLQVLTDVARMLVGELRSQSEKPN